MAGGLGNDTYYVDDLGDRVYETAATGGTDTVYSSVSFTLGDNVENLTLTGTADINVTGNELANSITGNDGDNILDSGAGNDTLYGGAGNDSLDQLGGEGADRLIGGDGDDIYGVDSTGDVIVEADAEGTDTVVINDFSSLTAYTLSSNVENLSFFGFTDFAGTGNELDNFISGGAGNDTLDGGTGNDTLYGKDGENSLVGGLGDDHYLLVVSGDVITEYADAGTDTVESELYSYTLGNNIENLILWSNAHFGIGNDLDNVITAHNGSDTFLAGGEGNDTLDGGIYTQNDTLDGGAGNDSLAGARGNDLLIGGAGSDTLDGGVGNDCLAGGADADLYIYSNGDGNDTITADSANSQDILFFRYVTSSKLAFDQNGDDLVVNLAGGGSVTIEDWCLGAGYQVTIRTTEGTVVCPVFGSDGDDTLCGGTGYFLYGGPGDDTFVVDNVGVVVTENPGEGDDTVCASVNYSLAANVENLLLTGGDNLAATGNSLDNTITGNSGDNILRGGAGNDTLIGGAGNDTLIGNSDYNSLFGNDGNDSLYGNYGNDTLDGGAGADTMDGGLGNDLYIVDNAGDLVMIEPYEQGLRDRVISSVCYTLGVNIEDLTLTGTADLTAGGNNQDNILTGNSGNNILDAGDGADTLLGGGGNDTYYVYGYDDCIVESAGEGTDLVIVSEGTSFTLPAEVENLTFLDGPRKQQGGYGNDLANVINGNSFNNTILGYGSDDTLIGGGGDDTIDGGDGNDIIAGGRYDNDTYCFSGAFGKDIIAADDRNSLDTVDLRSFASSSAMISIGGFDGDDLIISIGSDTVTIADWGRGGGYRLNTFIFSDGTKFTDGTTWLPFICGTSGADTLTGTVNDDTISGLDGDDVLDGGDGDDYLDGGDGFDTLYGGAGNDELIGGIFGDIMYGGLGDDTFVVDIDYDVIIENPGEGDDTVRSSVDYSLTANVENLLLTGVDNLAATGNSLDNTITGNSGDNLLRGGIGNDTLTGGDGADTLDGAYGNIVNVGGGNKILYGDAGNDVLIGWYGNDTLYGGDGDDTIAGDGGNDNLVGNDGNDSLVGGGGNDTFDGGTGADTMVGSNRTDTFFVDDAGDVVIKEYNVQGPRDHVISAISYTLGANIEDLTLTGTNNLTGVGNELRNIITGTSGDNILDAGYGMDTMLGGIGNDTYYVDLYGDHIVEKASEGTDLVLVCRSSFSLPAEVENLTLLDVWDARNGIGNEIANVITGNSYDNTLIGNGGDDNLSGGSGNDTVDGGAGADTMIGGSGNDIYVVDDADDVVTENADAGTDTVTANISYTLAADFENLILTGGAITGIGNDLNNAITGNANDNIFTTGIGDDTIDGGTGSDSLSGGAGSDCYLFDVGYGCDTIAADSQNNRDAIVFGANTAEDMLSFAQSGGDLIISLNDADKLTVQGYYNGDPGYRLDDLRFSDSGGSVAGNILFGSGTITGDGTGQVLVGGSDNDTITGGAGADWLYAGGGRNVLSGGGGNDRLYSDTGWDTLSGGDGDDYLDGRSGYDSLIGGAGADIYRIGFGYGHDTIAADTINAADTVEFATGISGSMLRFSLSLNEVDLFIGLVRDNTIADSITLQGYASGIDGNMVNNFVFHSPGSGPDGTAFTWNYIKFGDGVITANSNDGVLVGYENADTMTGYAGNDWLYGCNSDDQLSGGDGNDQLYGGADNDTLAGGDGNDILDGGSGNDSLIGSSGNDTYIFGVGYGSDSIAADSRNSVDTVEFREDTTLGMMSFTQNGHDLTIWLNGTDALSLKDYYGLYSGNDNKISTFRLDNPGYGPEGVVYTWDYFRFGAGSFAALDGDGLTNEVLVGGSGDDTIRASVGNDWLYGGGGNDSMAGGDGNDIYSVDSAGDIVTELYYSYFTGGDDTVLAGVNYTLGANVEDLVLTGTADTSATGNSLDNIIFGNSSNNVFDGGAGADTLYGGTGNDIYLVDAADTIIEDSVAGTDTVIFGANYTLGANIENLTLTGTADVDGSGNSLNNIISGNSGNNVLLGGAGNDTLDGGDGFDTYLFQEAFGNDWIIRSSGNYEDRLVFAGIASTESYVGVSGGGNLIIRVGSNSVTIEGAATPEYCDHLFLFEFSDGLKKISSLTWVDAQTLAGTADADILTSSGSTGAVVYGLDGNDTLQGNHTGDVSVDVLAGGRGDDTYYIDCTSDIVAEAAGEGIDSIHASVEYTLPVNVETLVMSGNGSGTFLYGTGNGSDNTLAAESDRSLSNYVLDGRGGNDTLSGGAGNDIFDGGFGADYMVGGRGDDTYYVNEAGDIINEYFDEGIDTVISSIDYTLGADLENLTLSRGTDYRAATGNSLANVLIGNAGDNSLNGGAGSDTLDGSYGNDTLTGGDGDDFLYGAYINALPDGNDCLYGNNGSDYLFGWDGNDTLDGGAGNDTLTGGNGFDIYNFSESFDNDIISADSGNSQDTVDMSSFASTSASVSLGGDGGLDLIVTIGADTVTIAHWAYGGGNQLNTFIFSDGTKSTNGTGWI